MIFGIARNYRLSSKNFMISAGTIGTLVLFISQGAFSDTTFSSCSGKYASELEKKQDSLFCVGKEDIGKIQDRLRIKPKKSEPAIQRLSSRLNITHKDVAEIMPAPSRIHLEPNSVPGTLSPETKFKAIEKKTKNDPHTNQ